MLSHRDIARALLIEAYADLEAARVLRQASVYARCVAHCQHAVELMGWENIYLNGAILGE